MWSILTFSGVCVFFYSNWRKIVLNCKFCGVNRRFTCYFVALLCTKLWDRWQLELSTRLDCRKIYLFLKSFANPGKSQLLWKMNGSHRLGSCKNIRWDFIIWLHFLQELWGLFLKACVDNSFTIVFKLPKNKRFLSSIASQNVTRNARFWNFEIKHWFKVVVARNWKLNKNWHLVAWNSKYQNSCKEAQVY